MEMPLKKRNLVIFGKIGRDSGSASQNKESHYIWGRGDRYVFSLKLFSLKIYTTWNKKTITLKIILNPVINCPFSILIVAHVLNQKVIENT